jgi:hypothetical protein
MVLFVYACVFFINIEIRNLKINLYKLEILALIRNDEFIRNNLKLKKILS